MPLATAKAVELVVFMSDESIGPEGTTAHHPDPHTMTAQEAAGAGTPSKRDTGSGSSP
jgi:hypothetical protein